MVCKDWTFSYREITFPFFWFHGHFYQASVIRMGHLCFLSLCDSHYFYRDLFEKNLIVLTHDTLILFSEMVCQWTALRCLLRICCQRILKYQDRRKPSDFGSTVSELWHMLITCLRMSEMGKVQETVLRCLISLLNSYGRVTSCSIEGGLFLISYNI